MRPTTLLLACAAALIATAAPAQAAVPKIQLVKVYYDSPGVDRRSNSSLNGEYAVVRNTTRAALDLEGWTIADQTGYRYTFGPGQVLKAGKSLTLRTGRGTSGTSTVYWGRRAYVWNNDKDSAYVRDAGGRLVDKCSYNSSYRDSVSCL
ncbi:lamin tail domain-containing protein [Nonomuraea sp. NPDC059007]|uniref:lamin tail domain-containing protein n=1 Tax=Nonomuraea sp. NPDC059007 TaxID=3346692 RepID=UPI0036BB59E4